MTTKSRTMDANDLVDQLNSVKDRDLDSIFAKIEEKKKKSDEAAEQVKDAEQNVDRSKVCFILIFDRNYNIEFIMNFMSIYM